MRSHQGRVSLIYSRFTPVQDMLPSTVFPVNRSEISNMAYIADTVFNKLRVSDSNQPNYHTLYNGVSANTWLTPIGVAQKRDAQKQQKNGAWPLAEELKRTLCERAR